MNPLQSEKGMFQNMGSVQYPNGAMPRSMVPPVQSSPGVRYAPMAVPSPNSMVMMNSHTPNMMPPRSQMQGLPPRPYNGMGYPTAVPTAVQPRSGMPAYTQNDLMALLNKGPGPGPGPGTSQPGRPVGLMPSPQVQRQSEFSIHNEDFPALPGASREPNIPQNIPNYGYKKNLELEQESMMSNQYPSMGQYQPREKFMMNQPSTLPVPYAPRDAKQYAESPIEIEQKMLSHTTSQTMSGQDAYGLLGLLNVVNMSNQNLTLLSIGSDLTGLGLNLNSQECLYSTFSSPWADAPSSKEIDYRLPQCYYLPPGTPSSPPKFESLSDETLFYIFYSMPRDVMQDMASEELYKRNWRYLKDLKTWITKDTSVELLAKTPTYERGFYLYFDAVAWEKSRKEFVVMYENLEDRSSIQRQDYK